jgi:hypothetical protein
MGRDEIDPFEFADALRDGLLTGGADPGEADAAAEAVIERAERYNRGDGDEFLLFRIDPPR